NGRAAFYRDVVPKMRNALKGEFNLLTPAGVANFYQHADMAEKDEKAYLGALKRVVRWQNQMQVPRGLNKNYSAASILTLTHGVVNNPQISDQQMREVATAVTDRLAAAQARQEQLPAATPEVSIQELAAKALQFPVTAPVEVVKKTAAAVTP